MILIMILVSISYGEKVTSNTIPLPTFCITHLSSSNIILVFCPYVRPYVRQPYVRVLLLSVLLFFVVVLTQKGEKRVTPVPGVC